ncbi:dihydrolipoamide acetyltransferase family protein [Massilia soli]|uniref:Dihydrolipoamide acetyltransferase component of pyruvate dehydrogenase complex n=1 Tax=Massilia soli TaxID=2792854 RepID=A0ABS7SUN9_9BURK|nr:dihydrolipoamide acetyltransferase family protein [Massilia soli]MBZ2209678.1 2-oxo acid dehydrogenase subunit E2 [Massilia soli]
MGIHVIKMPDLGEGIAEVEVVEWRVQPGDAVTEDQVLADVMTDKATVEIPSPVHGTVVSLGGAIGQALAVGAELIRLEVEGDGNTVAGAPAPARAPAPPAAVAAPAPAPAPAQAPAQAPAPAPAPAAAAQVTVAAPPPAPAASQEKPLASPSVRQRARSLGIDLHSVRATGPARHITHADLDAILAGSKPGPAPAGNRYAPLEGVQAVPLLGLRRKIAEKMQDAKRRIPHFTYVEEVDVTDLESLRVQLNARHGAERGRLTLLPLLMRAVVLGAARFPHVNARFDDDVGSVTYHKPVHIGIATQTDAGLMVPVVRHAESRDLWASAAEVARLAEAARTSKAARDELSGSTITITSLGALGGIVTTPVINHPEVAIVGVNRMVERPVVRDGAIVVRKMMNLSCSFDHRVIDGMYAAQFVQALRAYLECPATLFID